MSVEKPVSLDVSVAKACEEFEARFQRKPALVVAAPGRVNLIGEHIDYCDGYVMPFAIPAYAVLAADPVADRSSAIISARECYGEVELALASDQEKGMPEWANYPKGVIQGFKDLGHTLEGGVDVRIHSDVPIGAGLSSSAALEVVFATLWEQLLGIELGLKEKALLSQKAEHDFAGVPCGIMDQFTSCYGKSGSLVLIDCKEQDASLVPFDNPDLAVIIANTKVSHSLSDGEYADRRRQTEEALAIIGKSSYRDVVMDDLDEAKAAMSELLYKRAKHVVSESQRTLDAAEALKRRDYNELGRLMNESHLSLRDDFEVSCSELDFLVDEALKLDADAGVLGARMTGGGFGGSTVTLCQATKADKIAEHLKETYNEFKGFEPEVLLVSPADGAMVIDDF